jgi:hypothetical protein
MGWPKQETQIRPSLSFVDIYQSLISREGVKIFQPTVARAYPVKKIYVTNTNLEMKKRRQKMKNLRTITLLAVIVAT